MNTVRKTFTVLVTIETEPESTRTPERLAEAIHTALEEGTRVSGPVLSAQVDAFAGCVVLGGHGSYTGADVTRLTTILPLHR